MASPHNVIHVPKPSPGAYHPGRPLSRNALVEAQVRHFAAVNAELPEDLRVPVDADTITTEGDAAAYIRQVTEAIHKGGGRPERTQKVKSAT
ncbi:MAG: hypothetical protein M3N93_02110 [Acidobacteriota bacterium]|nr:hypothetical protein [Acidobacteriota bacterium]